MYKDQVYFKGAIEILKNRRKINFTDLYSGKLDLKGAEILNYKNLISRQKILLPYFLQNQDKYLETLDVIAKANFIK